MENIERLQPRAFTKFCMSIGMVPSSYTSALTYEEQLLWFCSYLEKNVIPAVNNNAEALQEVQNLMVQLQDYVNNYFDNLDVQEEINNKLDDMADSGELENIISAYLNLNSIITFDTVADMKSSTSLVDGSFAKTKGYHSLYDGGAACYSIESITAENSDDINEIDVIQIGEDLLARLEYSTTMTFEQFGAYGDDSHDDTTVIKYCLESEKEFNFKPLQKVYKISNVININVNKSYDFNNATLKQYDNLKNILYYDEDSVDLENNTTKNNFLKNVVLDCNSMATSGLYIHSWYKLIDNIKIKNISSYGLYVEGGYENQFGTIRLYGKEGNNNSIGIYLNGSDSQFENIYGMDVKTLMQNNNKFAIINNIHAWIGHSSLSIGSKLIELLGTFAKLEIKELYVDTYNYGIYVDPDSTAANYINIDKLYCIAHSTNFDFTQGNPYVFSQYNNASTVNYNIGLADVRAESSAKFITFSQTRDISETPTWNGILENARFTTNVNSLNIRTSTMSPTSGLFGAVDVNEVRRSGRIRSFDFVGKINSANFTHSNTVIGTINSYDAPISNINYSCEVSVGEYNATNEKTLCYLYINTSGQITVDIPDNYTISDYSYLKIHITWIRS